MADELTPEEQQRLDSYEEDEDMSGGGGGGGEAVEPGWLSAAEADLKAKRTAGLATAAADLHAVGAVAAPPKPSLQRQARWSVPESSALKPTLVLLPPQRTHSGTQYLGIISL